MLEPTDTHNHQDDSAAVGLLSGLEYAEEPNAVPVPGFELIGELGRGGMGIVWRAKDLTLGREVAVKILQDRYNVDSPICERFLEESKITSQLQHPGIPAIYSMGYREDRRPWLAMKLIKGDTLDKLLVDNPNLNKLSVFGAIAQTVGYAHDRGVVHRDLKPSNVMIGSFGEVQVMDWGLAKLVGVPSESAPRPGDTVVQTFIRAGRESTNNPTRTGSLLGTPAFMSPEQACGEIHTTDARTDVFGLGGILCVMLTGKPPYDSNDLDSTREMARHVKLDDAMSRLDHCKELPGLVALCRDCLQKDKQKRPADGKEVARRIAALEQDIGQQAKNEEIQRARRKLAAAAAAVMMLVLAAGVIGTSVGWINTRKARDAEHSALLVAEKQRHTAEGNLDVVSSMTLQLARASEEFLPYVSQSDELREHLLTRAVESLKTIAAQRPDSEVVRELGRFLLQRGNVQRLRGQNADAEQSYLEALKHIPRDLEHAEWLVATLRDHAHLKIMMGRLKDAQRLNDEAFAELDNALEKQPHFQTLQRQRAWCLLQKAQISNRRREFDESVRTLDAATKSIDLLAAGEPHIYDAVLRIEVIRCFVVADREAGRQDSAMNHIKEGRSLLDRMTQGVFPSIPADDFNLIQFAFEFEVLQVLLLATPKDYERIQGNALKLVRLALNLEDRRPREPQVLSVKSEALRLCGNDALDPTPISGRVEMLRAAHRIARKLAQEHPGNLCYQANYGQCCCQLAAALGKCDEATALLAAGRIALRKAIAMSPEDAWYTRWLDAAGN